MICGGTGGVECLPLRPAVSGCRAIVVAATAAEVVVAAAVVGDR